MEAQSKHVHVAYMGFFFPRFGTDLHAQSVLIDKNFCIGAQEEVYQECVVGWVVGGGGGLERVFFFLLLLSSLPSSSGSSAWPSVKIKTRPGSLSLSLWLLLSTSGWEKEEDFFFHVQFHET